jgi:hypothetical protein
MYLDQLATSGSTPFKTLNAVIVTLDLLAEIRGACSSPRPGPPAGPLTLLWSVALARWFAALALLLLPQVLMFVMLIRGVAGAFRRRR